MAFEKGNKLGGRKKGSKNKATTNIREAFQSLIENNLERIQEDMDSLDAKDRLNYIISLTNYCVPKLKATELKVESDYNTGDGKAFNIKDIYNKIVFTSSEKDAIDEVKRIDEELENEY